MPTATIDETTTTSAPARTALTAKEAVALRDALRADGWRPLETATDWRATPLGTEAVGTRRTVVYVPEFKNDLGGAIAWWKTGDETVPDEAAYAEVYEAIGHGQAAVRWIPN